MMSLLRAVLPSVFDQSAQQRKIQLGSPEHKAAIDAVLKPLIEGSVMPLVGNIAAWTMGSYTDYNDIDGRTRDWQTASVAFTDTEGRKGVLGLTFYGGADNLTIKQLDFSCNYQNDFEPSARFVTVENADNSARVVLEVSIPHGVYQLPVSFLPKDIAQGAEFAEVSGLNLTREQIVAAVKQAFSAGELLDAEGNPPALFNSKDEHDRIFFAEELASSVNKRKGYVISNCESNEVAISAIKAVLAKHFTLPQFPAPAPTLRAA